MGKLADEKTLELNITHELLIDADIGALGFSKKEEARLTGGDILFPCSLPFILQFKAPYAGIDGVKGRFHINNNTDKTQHLMLHFWDISGLLRAFYVFPLIITDNFLTSNFGNLLSNTQAVDASLITTSNNLRINDWNRAHRLIIEHNCNFDVYSEKFEGKGFPAKELVDYIKKSKFSIESDQPISKYIPVLLKKMKSVVLQAGIRGSSEHTIYIMATNIRRSKVGILALPVLIKTSPESDRVTFT